MKFKNIMMMLIAAIAVSGFSNCSDDDHSGDDMGFTKNVTLEESYVELNPAESIEIAITDGNGQYKAVSSDESVATVEVVSDKIKVTALKAGQSFVRVTDSKRIQTMLNILVYGDLKLGAETLVSNNNGAEGGYSEVVSCSILSGNGEYRVESDSELVDARIAKDDDGVEYISVYTIGEVVDSEVRVFDRTGRMAKFTVTGDDLFKAFKAKTDLHTEFNGVTRVPGEEGFSYVAAKSGDYYRYYWGKNYANCLDIRFLGDFSVGVKTGAQYKYGVSNAEYVYSYTAVNWLYIVKRDATKVWIAFEAKSKSGDSLRGYMLQNIIVEQ